MPMQVSQAPFGKALRLGLASGLGVSLGLGVVHPYSMAVNRILMGPENQTWEEVLRWSGMAFSLHMWPMSAFYGFLGACFGLGVGLLIERRREVEDARRVADSNRAAQETLKEVTLTVAHYIRNANAPIGGCAARLMKRPEVEPPVREGLGMIIEESRQIDAIVNALDALENADAKEEVGTTHLRMLDIRKAIQNYGEAHNRQDPPGERLRP